MIHNAPVPIALLGLGNVGRAFARYLLSQKTHLPLLVAAAADSTGGVLLDSVDYIARLLEHKDSGSSVRNFAGTRAMVEVDSWIRTLAAKGVSLLVETLPTNL